MNVPSKQEKEKLAEGFIFGKEDSAGETHKRGG